MITMQNNIFSFTATRPDFVLAAPSCPTCSPECVVKATPTAFTPGLVDVSYVCGECGREAKRTIKGFNRESLLQRANAKSQTPRTARLVKPRVFPFEITRHDDDGTLKALRQ